MPDKIEFRITREFGDIVGDTFLFIKQNFKPLLKAFIYLCGFFIIGAMIAGIIQQLSMKEMITASHNRGEILKQTNLIVKYGFTLLFGIGNYVAITVTVLSYIAIYIKNGNVPPTVEEVWAYFKFYFFRVLLSSVITGVFFIFCLMFCLIPGIYVFPATCLIFPVMIMENASFDYSFGRSFKLLKDNWGATSGALLIIWIITYATTSMISLPGILLSTTSTFLPDSTEMNSVIVIVATIIQYACQVFLIVPLVGISLCYFNLVERHENTGLLERIAKLGEVETPLKSAEEY